MNFTHPVKELLWTVQPTNFTKLDYTQTRGGSQPFNFTDLWDYSGFNGTPEPKNGVGMPGGRISHNLNGGFSGIKFFIILPLSFYLFVVQFLY